MIKLQNRNIATKIGLVIGLFTLLLAACAGFALYGLAQNNKVVQSVLGDQGKSLYLASTAAEQKTRIHQRAFELLGVTDATKWAPLQAGFEKDATELGGTISELKPLMDGEDLKLFGPIQNSLTKYVDLEKQGYAMKQGGRAKDFEAVLEGDMAREFEVMDASFDALVDKQKHDMDQATAGINESAIATQWRTIALSVAGLLATIVAAFFLVRLQITRPLAVLTSSMGRLASGDVSLDVAGLERKDELGALANAMQVFKKNAIDKIRASEEQADAMGRLGAGLKSLADGDLRVSLDDSFPAQYAQIRHDFNETVDKLQETMRAVVTSTSAIHSGTNEISSASDDLSLRTEQQAASLEETAASLGAITATVKRSAESAEHAREVVASANQDAKDSAVVVRQAVEAMDAIAKSSGQITQIIGVIDEIAFQTNLLALNAGVEAARAGDAGRGFAVVASEVRALAQRSADAAKQIKGLISTSTGQVDFGVKLVAKTGVSLERINAKVTEINGIIVEIAAGAQEQATGLQQVNAAINQMDQTTQQNATMVEEFTAASHSLSQETDQLSNLIGRFQIGQSSPDNAMRAQLHKVAPHAVRRPSNRAA